MQKVEKVYSEIAEEQDRCPDEQDERPEAYIRLRTEFSKLVGDGTILDAGCGPGMDTAYFAKQGFEAVGIDIAEGMLAYARKNKEGTFRNMDIRDLAYGESVFEGVFCNAAIFFYPPDQMKEILADFSHVLGNDGVLYVNFKQGEGSGIREKQSGSVRQYYIGEARARNLLSDGGFTIIEYSETVGPDKNFLNFICEAK